MGLLGTTPDPLDLGGTAAAKSTIKSARTSADLIRRFSEQSQANLQPFLDLSQRTLPGLEAGATLPGFFSGLEELRPIAESISGPVAEERLREFNTSLAQRGLTRSGVAATGAADIQEQADLEVLLQLQSMFTSRQQAVVGGGVGTATNLSRLGERSSRDIADILGGGQRSAGQAVAAGQQNIIDLAGFGAGFFSPRANTTPAGTGGPRV